MCGAPLSLSYTSQDWQPNAVWHADWQGADRPHRPKQRYSWRHQAAKTRSARLLTRESVPIAHPAERATGPALEDEKIDW